MVVHAIWPCGQESVQQLMCFPSVPQLPPLFVACMGFQGWCWLALQARNQRCVGSPNTYKVNVAAAIRSAAFFPWISVFDLPADVRFVFHVGIYTCTTFPYAIMF